jgi:hypothetical protein
VFPNGSARWAQPRRLLGIHPAILTEGGLAPALKTLARRSPISVALDVRVEGRLPDGVEVAAYYVVSEMLTNTAKRAGVSCARLLRSAAAEAFPAESRVKRGARCLPPASGIVLCGATSLRLGLELRVVVVEHDAPVSACPA